MAGRRRVGGEHFGGRKGEGGRLVNGVNEWLSGR